MPDRCVSIKSANPSRRSIADFINSTVGARMAEGVANSRVILHNIPKKYLNTYGKYVKQITSFCGWFAIKILYLLQLDMAKLKSLVKTGFGLGIGIGLASMIFLAVGMALFIGGYVMFMKEKKSSQPVQSKKIFGIVLMGLGCIIGLGFGGPILLDSIGDMV